MASFTLGRMSISLSWGSEHRALRVAASVGNSRAEATLHGPDMDVGAWLDLAGDGAGEEPIGIRLHAALFQIYATVSGPAAEALASRLSSGSRTITGAGARVVRLHDEVDVVLSAAWGADLWVPTRWYVAGTLRDLLMGPSAASVRTAQEEHHLRLADGTYQVRFEARSVEMARPRAPWLTRTTTTISATVLSGPIATPGTAIILASTSIPEAIGEMLGVLPVLRLAGELGHSSDRAHNA